MLSNLYVSSKLIYSYFVRRWVGCLFFLLIVCVSTIYALRADLSIYLRYGITWTLYALVFLVFAPVFAELIKEFDDMLRSIGRSIKTRWLLVIPHTLNITDDDTLEIIEKKVSHYVNQEVAKQDQAFTLWQQSLRGKQPNTRLRPLWLLFAGVIAFCILWWSFSESKKSLPEWLDPSKPGLATLITIGIGLPVAYMVWLFRDQNNLWQIENSRKDINLKDFQRLSEIACGTHYPEQKTDDESYPLRKQAAQSQQVAAIYQLQAFIEGAYGSQFIRPTFLLLKSVWGSLVEKDQIHWDDWVNQLSSAREVGGWTKSQYGNWKEVGNEARDMYYKQFSQPLGLALQEVLGGDTGHRIRQNIGDMPSSLISGVNSNLPGMKPLQLANQILNDVSLRGSDLSRARLQGADLSNSYLEGANLGSSQLQGANLQTARMQGAMLAVANLQAARLVLTNLQGATLFSAYLQGANLSMATLTGASLMNADLRAAKLINANLEGSDLSQANLQGADLRDSVWDEYTNFDCCKINLKTKFGTRLIDGRRFDEAIESDWIDGDIHRLEWINRGAVMV